MQRAGLFVGESGGFDRVRGSGRLAVENFVTSVWAARDGTVWAGTSGGGLYGLGDGREVHITTANGLAEDAMLAVCVDAEGSVWASTGAGTVHRFGAQGAAGFDTEQGLPGTPVTVLSPTATGGLWLGTQDGQILRDRKSEERRIGTTQDPGHHPVLALLEGEQTRL